MSGATTTVSRIEFRTNLMRADSQVITLGVLVDANWADGVRWLGMIYRPNLTKNEKQAVNFKTWRELEQPEGFLLELFGTARDHGVDVLTRDFGCLSALHVAIDDEAVDITAGLPSAADPEVRQELVRRLDRFLVDLEPSYQAEVVRLNRKPAAPKTEDVLVAA